MREMYSIVSHTFDLDWHRIYVTIMIEKGKYVDIMCITEDEFGRTYEYIMDTGYGYEVYDIHQNTYDINLNTTLLYKMGRIYVSELLKEKDLI